MAELNEEQSTPVNSLIDGKFPCDLDELFENPNLLGNATPGEWFDFLEKNGHIIRPLGRGNFKDKSFRQGGGFRVHWNGDRILQYHPPEQSHHDGAYWKISSGVTGVKRYDLQGNTEVK